MRAEGFEGDEMAASVKSSILQGGRAMTSDDFVEVELIDFTAFLKDRIAERGEIAFAKMDIEGAEFSVLPALVPWLREHRPVLYLSTHAPFLPEDERATALAQLADALSFYNSATPDAGTYQTVAQALSSAAAQTGFQSFLLSDQ